MSHYRILACLHQLTVLCCSLRETWHIGLTSKIIGCAPFSNGMQEGLQLLLGCNSRGSVRGVKVVSSAYMLMEPVSDRVLTVFRLVVYYQISLFTNIPANMVRRGHQECSWHLVYTAIAWYIPSASRFVRCVHPAVTGLRSGLPFDVCSQTHSSDIIVSPHSSELMVVPDFIYLNVMGSNFGDFRFFCYFLF